MKSILKVLAFSLLGLFIIVGILALIYFLNPSGVQEQVYNRFFPKVKNTEKFDGKILVEIPEVYELMWIACSLTPAFEADDNLTSDPNDFPAYKKAVKEHFDAYKAHPLIDALQGFLADGNYDLDHMAIRFLSLNYELDETGSLKKTNDYAVSGILTSAFKKRAFLIPAHQKLINDFSQKTDFKSFYKKHSSFYQQLTQNYHQLGDLKGMWEWLEDYYPNRIQSYRILCSPMTGGFHNTMPFEGKEGFQQALMFVNAPPLNIESLEDSVWVRTKSAYSRIVFTEIDHNYVNPLADKYRAEIQNAIPDYQLWNTGKQGYQSAHNTFLEYMTFGMYSLFAQKQFSDWQYNYAISRVEAMMSNYRGFKEFPAFNQELIQYYEQSGKEKDMDALFVHMISWMKNYSKTLANQ